MTAPATTPAPDDEEALAERLADLWVERALVDPAIRRAALRAVGLIKEPAEMTIEELADSQGTSRRTLNRIANRLLRKLKLNPEIQAMKPDTQQTSP